MSLRLSPTLELAQRVSEARAAGKDAWSLSTPSFPAPSTLPTLDAKWLKLSPPEGLPQLRDAARAAFFKRWDAPDHACVITAGAKAAIFSVLQAALAPGARVIVPGPAWPSYADLCKAARLEAVPLATLAPEFELDASALKALAPEADAILLANPCNPTGRILNPEELSMLAEMSDTHGLLLILDQSFSSIIFDHAAWAASVIPGFERLVVIDSFSKNYLLQGARVAAALLPPRLTAKVVAAHQTIMSAAPTPGQYLALKSLETSGAMPDLTAQRARAAEFIIDQGLETFPQQGSFYFFPKVVDFADFETRAAARGVHLLSGQSFGGYDDHFRLCFGRPLDELETIIQRLSEP